VVSTPKDVATKAGSNIGHEHGHHANPNWSSQTSAPVAQQNFVGDDYQGYQNWTNYNNPAQGMNQYNGQMWGAFDNEMMGKSSTLRV